MNDDFLDTTFRDAMNLESKEKRETMLDLAHIQVCHDCEKIFNQIINEIRVHRKYLTKEVRVNEPEDNH